MKIETSISNVAKIEIGERHNDGKSDWWREIVVTTTDGTTYTLSLYSNDENEETALKVST